MKKILTFIFIINSLFFKTYANELKKIEILGNDRIPSETIIMFSDVNVNQNINEININSVLKNLYNSNFFDNVTVDLYNNILTINVVESPIIENITYNGIKAKKIREAILKDLKLKSRSSYNEFLLQEDKKKILSVLKDIGYYYSNIETFITDQVDNKISITYNIELGEKAKIKKISFIGNKIYKNRKLRSVIVSEEYQFWKIISGKKFLNENIINLDKRLLKNFYLNKGFYNVVVNSSFAKMVNDNEFELIYNINPGKKIYFNNLSMDIPTDFEVTNFSKINDFFESIKGEPYSINLVEKIIGEIENITINEEYVSVKASLEENLISDQLDIKFKIEEAEKYFVKKINIFGNNVTQESVIRNQFEIDEGDPFNEILQNKTINNLKNLNFFRNVKSEIIDDDLEKTKTINISVEEKPTGEIFAGAGAGTAGTSLSFGIKENNYLGKGIGLTADATLTEESFKGKFSVSNPNFRNSDKFVFFNVQAIEIDRLTNFGYKTNQTGFDIGTGFEYFDDLNFSITSKNYFEDIEASSLASARQKANAGNYFDTFIALGFDYDKRNQRFKTTDGFRSNYNVQLPLVSDTNTLTNAYDYRFYTELYEDNISSLSVFFKTSNSITGEDVKLSERLYIPGSKLRGFESGKVGPKDGNDFIGGNFLSSFNASTTLPQLLPNSQDIDVSLFFDAANVWGVDYDSSLNDGSKIRSSLGVAVDWFTIIGPMTFSLSEAITKLDTDITESFRFNIGTSF